MYFSCLRIILHPPNHIVPVWFDSVPYHYSRKIVFSDCYPAQSSITKHSRCCVAAPFNSARRPFALPRALTINVFNDNIYCYHILWPRRGNKNIANQCALPFQFHHVSFASGADCWISMTSYQISFDFFVTLRRTGSNPSSKPSPTSTTSGQTSNYWGWPFRSA
jgi:hypothetical protein